MQINLVSTLFGSLITAAIAALGWIIKRYILDNPKQQKLLKERLEKVYAPLSDYLEKDSATFQNFVAIFECIVNENKEIIPNQLKKLFDSVERMKSYTTFHEFSISDIRETVLHIESNYNWLKKKQDMIMTKTKFVKNILVCIKR